MQDKRQMLSQCYKVLYCEVGPKPTYRLDLPLLYNFWISKAQVHNIKEPISEQIILTPE